MALIVVGGHTRNIGKTSVMTGLVAALPERQWVAIKITQFGHGICSTDGKECGCATADHRFAITEEKNAAANTDTARYLRAGAGRSLWVRSQQGSLQEAMPKIRQELAKAAEAGRDVVVESNSLLRFVRPDVFVSVIDPASPDFKGSARRYLDRADAILTPAGGSTDQAWSGEVARIIRRIPVFHFAAPVYVPAEVVDYVRERLALAWPALPAG